MLRDGHELHVREPHAQAVVHEHDGEVLVAQVTAPRPEVHLVRAHRLGVRLGLGPATQPVVVGPGVRAGVDDGRGLWRHLGRERERVRLLPPDAVGAQHLELVPAPVPDAGDEQLPHAGRPDQAHRVRPAVPVVEVADEPDAPRVGCPHRERRAGDRAVRRVEAALVRAEDLPELLVAPLGDEMLVELAQRRQEAVRVVGCQHVAVVGHLEPVVRHRRGVEDADPHPVALVAQARALASVQHRDRLGPGPQHADRDAAVMRVRPEHGVRLRVRTADKAVELLPRDGPGSTRPGRLVLGRALLRARLARLVPRC